MTQFELEDKEWKSFEFGNIFNIRASKSSIDKNKIIGNGDIPYITRSDRNNGLSLFVSFLQDDKYKIENGNVITLGLDTNSVSYQPHKFHTGQNIHILSFDSINQYIGLFIIPLIKKQLEKFSWGSNGATLTRVKRTSIMLPINAEGRPDWKFMEDYARCIYQKKKIELKRYRISAYKKLIYKVIPSLEEKKWQSFEIEKIFEIKNGIRLTKMDREEGKIPYVGASSINNGVTDFTSSQNNSIDSNVLGVNYNGSVAEGFYHPYEAIFGDDVKRLKLKNCMGNKFVYLFLALLVRFQKEKFEWGFKMNTQRLKKQRIMLPVNNGGEPDFVYMTQYMMNIEYQNLKRST